MKVLRLICPALIFGFTLANAQTPSSEIQNANEPPSNTSEQSAEMQAARDHVEALEEALFKPFVERYILDEIKALRQELQMLRAEVTERVAAAKLESSDRAIRYTTDTVNNIFYIITATASIFVLLGFRSLREIRSNIESVTSEKLSELTAEYETRLDEIERAMRRRSEQLIATQEEISTSNQIHSLWMRANLEINNQEKVAILDQILEIKPNDVEALTYKADALLDLGEVKWALALSDQAIQQDHEYALAYWQRACANAELGRTDEAILDIEKSVELSESFRVEIRNEAHFEKLKGQKDFETLCADYITKL